MDHTLNFNLKNSAIVDIGEWYGLGPSASVRSVHHIFRSSLSVQLLYSQKQWLTRRLYLNEFNLHKT